MSNWKSRSGIALVSGLAAAVAFSLPVYPSSWAKPPVVKVMADEARQQTAADFEEGKQSNIKMGTEGKQAVLTVGDASNTATFTSPVLKSDIVFTDVGIHWKDRSNKKLSQAVQFELRYSMDGEKWSDWKKVQIDPDDGADHVKNAETFSKLVYVGSAQYLQYRVKLQKIINIIPRIKDIKVTFINSRDGQKVEQKKSFWELLFDWVDAAVDKPPIVSRAEWGADESLRFNKDGTEKWPREYHPVTHLFVHHTDTELNDPDPPARVRAIYYYHTVTKGWGDIGYNAIIGSDGRIYEGRKGQDNDVLTPGVVGAGTYGFNTGGFSVSLMGTYQNAPLPANMRDALVKLLAYEAKTWKIDPLGKSDFVRDGNYDTTKFPPVDHNVSNISGHRDSPYTPGTLCPGDYVYNDLPNIRQDVANLLKADQATSANIKRLDGANRFEVSANISQELNNLNIASDTVVVARGDLYTDALSGGPLASKLKSPILLTSTNSLPTAIQTEIQRRKPAKAIILGGTGSVSTTVESQLQGMGITVERIDGLNRFEVSAKVAEKVVAGGTADTAIIASGLNFPDALSASSVAGQKGYPILLVGTSSIPDPIKTFIQNHPEITKYVIVGGPATVSDTVKTELESMGKTVTRVGGANRFEVGVNLIQQFNLSPATLVFARGDVFADALSGGPLAASTSAPILLTPSTTLAPAVETYLKAHTAEFKKAYILGGLGSVSADVQSKIAGYMSQ